MFEAPKVGTIELISDLKGAPPAKVVKFDIIAGASLVNREHICTCYPILTCITASNLQNLG